jgi:phosphoribosylformimino-5-aminoimidazole carboxamide ribotide isomerase
MRVIPVIDLRGGRAVHARGGARHDYRPVCSVLHHDADALGLATAYRDRLGLRELYLADLDAIAGGPPDVETLRRLAEAGLGVWVDAGLGDSARARALLDAGATTVIAATETLPGPEALVSIIDQCPDGSVAFGLDLRAGRPLLAAGSSWPSTEPEGLVETAWALGVRRFVLIDLGRVGSGEGVGTLGLAREIGRQWPGAEVTLGGGVSRPSELTELRAAGVSAVLVGSALHDGRLGRADVEPPGVPR